MQNCTLKLLLKFLLKLIVLTYTYTVLAGSITPRFCPQKLQICIDGSLLELRQHTVRLIYCYVSFCCIGRGYSISLSLDNFFYANLLFQELTAAVAGSASTKDVAIKYSIPRKTLSNHVSAKRREAWWWRCCCTSTHGPVEGIVVVVAVEHGCPLKRTDTKHSVRPYAIESSDL